MATNVSASLSPINPNTLFSEGYELADQSIIPNENITAAFVPFEDKVEYWVYDFNKNLVGGEYNFTGYNLAQNPSSNDENDTTTVELSPINDLLDFGFDTGQLYTVYNFIRYQLSSTPDNRYYIAEISSDRTELRLKSNIISNQDIFSSFQQLKSELNSSEYFDEFYITFGDNEYNIGVNIELDTTGEIYSVLVKLYDALPPNFGLKNEAYVVTKVAESVGYQIEYPDLIEIPTNVTLIQGPNTNIELKDFVNNSTELKSKTELTATNSSISGDNLANILNRKGVTITPNYSYDTFNEFVNFSSAKKRIENFVEKVRQIQVYEADITTLSTITGPTSQSTEVTTNIASAYTNIETLVKNFDGYEYFLYYNTGSSSYPKSTSTFPYTLYSTTDTTVLEWLGSDVEGSQYYGGILLSASLYDNNNQNWLYYTIPEFIRENSDNDQYLEFSNMVGQHFDEIWLYTKAVSEKLNTTSDVDSGVPLQLADDVITSLGYKGFSNNYNNQDNFIGLTGENSGSYVPPTGSELITDYIAVNNGEELFQYGNFINQHISSSFPYAIDKVSKEIYKRLYHNMAYLTKKKGTISGLRQLINIWGIPNTILRINEFGGKNKDNSDDYDLWYNRYNYTFKPLNSESGFAQAKMPWLPLQKNFITEGEQIVPDCIQFRFKTNGAPGIAYTSSLIAKKSNDVDDFYFDFGIELAYNPPTTGSYLGASSSEYENWGTMRLVMSGSTADGGDAISDPIYLPFFDKGWWSVMLQRDTHVSASDNSNATTYTLYAKNNIYNGWDGNQIGFEGSASIVSNVSTSINEAWNKFGSSEYDTSIWLGADSRVEVGSTLIQQNANFPFSGSFQEFRYYSSQLPETVFNDYVMNPESIEGINITGPSSSFNLLNFRAALGNELESTFISPALGGGVSEYVPIHPSIVGSTNGVGTGGIFTTQSFYRGGTPVSIYYIVYPSASAILPYSTTNTEVYFLDQPAVGVRNRINNKIKIDDGQDYGTTLSSLRSIQQNYQISRSYTEDINSLEVAFSPQDEVNDDIIQTFGFGVVSDVLADPRFLSSSDDYYPGLRSIAKEYFEKYSQGNIYDYLRLIKYFDNSIFKAIKNYVPARTSVSTGIVIKQHLLERNRRRPVQLSEVTKIAVTPSGGFNTPIVRENLELTSSIEIGSFSGGTGGVVEKFNYTGSLEFGQLPNTQSWNNNIPTVLGLTTIVEDTQKEFYDGEYSGSNFPAYEPPLFNNPFLKPSTIEPFYSASVINVGLRDYYSIPEDTIFEFIEGDPSIDEVTTWVNTSMSMATSSVVWVTGSADNWYITALALAATSSNGEYGVDNVDNSPNALMLVFDHFSSNITLNSYNILPPENIYNVSYPYGGETSRNRIPYITFPLPDITNGYDSLLDLSTQHITTFGLAIKESIILAQLADYNPSTHPYNYARTWTFYTSSANPKNETPRPIVRMNTSDPISEIIGISSGSSGIKYISPYSNYKGELDTTSSSSYAYRFIHLNEDLQPGDIQTTFQGTTFQATSSAEMEYWYPSYILIHNVDLTGRNNAPSFALDPNFAFDLTPLNTLRNDGTGVDTDRVDTSLLVEQEPPLINYLGFANLYGYNLISLSNRKIGGTRTNTYVTGSNSTLVAFNPYIDPTVTANFENSDYFATPNNYNQNRLNSYLMNIEYENGISIPSNLSLILNSTAEKTQTPDSNYTTKKSILPRYEGVKVSSANYNHYTSASSGAEFRDGSTGSWSGDSSYGKTAAIDKNPIYFGHFVKSFNNFSIFDTTDYLIDQLIEVPFEDIKGQNIEPKVIKIEGDNSKLQDIVSTFEKNRKLSAIYESEIKDGINYSLNSLNKLPILNPGSKYITTATNQIEPGQIPSSSFNTSYRRFKQEIILFSTDVYNNFVRPFNTDGVNMITGSGFLQLSGSVRTEGFQSVILFSNTVNSSSLNNPNFQEYYNGLTGPFLSIMHHYNYCLKNKIFNTDSPLTTPSSLDYGILEGINNSNPNNYFRFNPKSSSLSQYEDLNEPFLIERGDEIRITYNTGSVIYTQDFTVLNVGFTDYISGSADNNFRVYNNANPAQTGSFSGSVGSVPMRQYNKIFVYPDPSTLVNPIPNGNINQFTHRKRKNADNVVNVVLSPLEGSNGASTYSGKGYLIPNDLTEIQKRNVQALITQLKSKNSFTNDDTV
jgi:hypothetical protein